jgi:hypothetical protein
MLDETIITETPPLSACYGHVGEQVCVPITGAHARRVRHGVLNIRSGELLLLITEEWVQETPQAFLAMIRAHWRGWHIVLFEDRGSPHLADESLYVARKLHIELRFLPKATPELNAIDASADSACWYLLAMSRHERLRKAGVFSGNCWLTQ